jgi:hypothetical protein
MHNAGPGSDEENEPDYDSRDSITYFEDSLDEAISQQIEESTTGLSDWSDECYD